MQLNDAIKLALENSIKYDKTYYVMRFWPEEPEFYSVVTRDYRNNQFPLIFDCLYAFDAGDLLKAIDIKVIREIFNDNTIEPIINPKFTHRYDELKD